MSLLLFDSQRCCTYAGCTPLRAHTRSSVRVSETEPCSPFVHATGSDRMAPFLSSALYLPFPSPHKRRRPFYWCLCSHWNDNDPHYFRKPQGLQPYIHWCLCVHDASPCRSDEAGERGDAGLSFISTWLIFPSLPRSVPTDQSELDLCDHLVSACTV